MLSNTAPHSPRPPSRHLIPAVVRPRIRPQKTITLTLTRWEQKAAFRVLAGVGTGAESGAQQTSTSRRI